MSSRAIRPALRDEERDTDRADQMRDRQRQLEEDAQECRLRAVADAAAAPSRGRCRAQRRCSPPEIRSETSSAPPEIGIVQHLAIMPQRQFRVAQQREEPDALREREPHPADQEEQDHRQTRREQQPASAVGGRVLSARVPFAAA